MQIEQDERKAVISSSTAEALDKFLRFRHVVCNIYGFELETDRVDTLLTAYPVAWAHFEMDMKGFVDWLRELAIALEA